MLSLLIYGTIQSVILAFYALGFSLAYGISGVANFAHGGLFILSGFIAWSFMNYCLGFYPRQSPSSSPE
jgi:branched-chain amino acid transport system permease protein